MRNLALLALVLPVAGGCYASWSRGAPGEDAPTSPDAPERPDGPPSPWVLEVIDDGGHAGVRQAIVADEDGAVYVSYMLGHGNGWGLAFATNAGGAGFEREMIADGDYVGELSSVALDPDGRAVVCYYDDASGDLRLARRSAPGSWPSEHVDGVNAIGYECSLQVDAAGTTHVEYADGHGEMVRYANDADGFWAVDELGVGSFPSLALDPEGSPHVSFVDDVGRVLHYATRVRGGWDVASLPPVSEPLFSSLAIDGDGAAHLAFSANWPLGEYHLWYATNVTGQWTTELLDDAPDDDLEPSLALDRWGAVHIAYIQVVRGPLDDRALRYATNASGAWVAETVDDDADTGYDPAIAVDPRGGVHIVYGENAQDLANPAAWVDFISLQYAHRAPPGAAP